MNLPGERLLRKYPVWWVVCKPFLVFSLSLDQAEQKWKKECKDIIASRLPELQPTATLTLIPIFNVPVLVLIYCPMNIIYIGANCYG